MARQHFSGLREAFLLDERDFRIGQKRELNRVAHNGQAFGDHVLGQDRDSQARPYRGNCSGKAGAGVGDVPGFAGPVECGESPRTVYTGLRRENKRDGRPDLIMLRARPNQRFPPYFRSALYALRVAFDEYHVVLTLAEGADQIQSEIAADMQLYEGVVFCEVGQNLRQIMRGEVFGRTKGNLALYLGLVEAAVGLPLQLDHAPCIAQKYLSLFGQGDLPVAAVEQGAV